MYLSDKKFSIKIKHTSFNKLNVWPVDKYQWKYKKRNRDRRKWRRNNDTVRKCGVQVEGDSLGTT